jgi:hypothetical protein
MNLPKALKLSEVFVQLSHSVLRYTALFKGPRPAAHSNSALPSSISLIRAAKIDGLCIAAWAMQPSS